MDTAIAQIQKLAHRQAVIRSKDLDALGISRTYLRRLVLAGKLERVARGIYSSPSSSATEHRTLL